MSYVHYKNFLEGRGDPTFVAIILVNIELQTLGYYSSFLLYCNKCVNGYVSFRMSAQLCCAHLKVIMADVCTLNQH